MVIDDAIKHVELLASGRTRYEGQKPFYDEVLLEEVKKLRKKVKNLERDIYYWSKKSRGYKY